MTQRRPLILAVLAIVVIAVALLMTRQHGDSSTGGREPLLYPELKGKLDSVDAVRVFKGGDARVVEVTRNGTAWTVADRGGYPADDAKIRKLLIAAADAKRVEEKTSNPENYAAIGVEDVSAATATGHRIEIAGGGAPVNLIVGKQAGRSSQYVRRAEDKHSWQINGTLDVPTSTDAWLRKDIVDIGGDRIQSVTVTVNGKPWSATKAARADADFKVEGIPKGKELNAPTAANSVSSSLAMLTLADVRKASDLQTQTSTAHATFKAFDGLVTEADGWVQDGKHYIVLSTSYDETLAQRFKAPAAEPAKTPTTDANSKPETPPAAPERNVAEEAKTLNATLTGWAYEIPDYKYEAIFKPIDELLKKDEPVVPKKK
jgi:hypothetical protein